MIKGTQITAFEGGALRVLATGEKSREAVLALPLNRLLARLVRVPAGGDAEAVAREALQAISPFPDDPLTVSCETIREGEGHSIVLAAALPENAADDIGAALDEKKLSVVRIDLLVLGALRGLWNALNVADGQRRLVLIKSPDCISLVVLDGDQPSALRAFSDASELWREVTLSLLEAENFGGALPLAEIVVTGEFDAEVLSTFAPVRTIEVGEDAALVGIAARAEEAGTLNALPASWADVLAETRFKKKLIRNLAIAGGVWLLVMGVLLGVPIVFGFMTDHQKGLSKAHARQYKAVRAMQTKIEIISKYSNHTLGMLEIMKAVSDRLPAGITLTSWDFKQDERLCLWGEADQSKFAREFKDQMEALTAGEGEDAPRVFPVVELGQMTSTRGKQRFSITLSFKKPEEAE